MNYWESAQILLEASAEDKKQAFVGGPHVVTLKGREWEVVVNVLESWLKDHPSSSALNKLIENLYSQLNKSQSGRAGEWT